MLKVSILKKEGIEIGKKKNLNTDEIIKMYKKEKSNLFYGSWA